MKKRIITVAVCLMAFALVGGGTLAYFNAQDDATNVISLGNVNLKLHDETTGGADFPTDGISGIMPGGTVDKVVYVENTGDNSIYVRIKLTDVNFDDETMNLDLNATDWTYSNGYYYYKAPLAPGAKTTTLFNKVTFSNLIGNESMDRVVNIYVDAQGVQSENNGANAQAAAGWPADKVF